MAKAILKTILFVNSRHDKKLFTHPVAVFPGPDAAKSYATFLRLAHRAGDKEAALALDPATHLTAEGDLIPDTKWSLATVRYAPEPELAEDDTALTDALAS
jgi:hypothetical protein